MPSVSEDDFNVVASAACDAFDQGDMEAAHKLDKLARKINAVLSRAAVPILARQAAGATYLGWRDMPSVLPTTPERTEE